MNLYIGLRVSDVTRSVAFYTAIGYEVLGEVAQTEIGALTMLKLPDDEFVALELVHDRSGGPIEPAGMSHLVIQVDDVHDRCAVESSRARMPKSPDRPTVPRTSGRRGQLIQMVTASSSSSGLPGIPPA